LRVFLAWPALLGRTKTAAGIAAALTPWPSQKSTSNAALCNFFQVLTYSKNEILSDADAPFIFAGECGTGRATK